MFPMVQRPRQQQGRILSQYIGGKPCSVAKAARILCVHPMTIRRMIYNGELIGWRPGRQKYLVYLRQVMDMAARKQAVAIRRAELLQMELPLDF